MKKYALILAFVLALATAKPSEAGVLNKVAAVVRLPWTISKHVYWGVKVGALTAAVEFIDQYESNDYKFEWAIIDARRIHFLDKDAKSDEMPAKELEEVTKPKQDGEVVQ